MSGQSLATYVREQMDKRGWDQTELGRRADIPKGTIHNILNNRVQMPEFKNMVKLASAFDVPLGTILTMAGFDLEGRPELSRAERQAELLSISPRFRELLDMIAALPKEDQETAWRFVEVLVRRNQENLP